jgi:glycosyltransferase involved in cell wall biosynthesis
LAPPINSPTDDHRLRVAVVLKGYPRLSETFVAQELAGLEQAGLSLALYSLRHPTDKERHPIHDRIAAPVTYLPEYLRDDVGRVRRAWKQVRRLPGYKLARRRWLADLKRDRTRNRIRRFGQALVLAAELPADISHIYAHFLHTPASVARYAALVLGLPFSISAHAKDIWTSPDWEIAEKITDARWIATCTAANRDHLSEVSSAPSKVNLIYHGLDFTHIAPAQPRAASSDGSDPSRPVTILSVGRLVAKKGYDDLLKALSELPATLHWRFEHIGRWDLKDNLAQQAGNLGIADGIEWHGPQARDAVMAAYGRADLFVLASKIADDGDRDGIPNVLMEAMSQGAACIATRVSGIPELIDDGVTGWLAPPADPAALTAIISSALAHPEARARVAEAANQHVREHFGFDRGLHQLLELFDQNPASAQASGRAAA